MELPAAPDGTALSALPRGWCYDDELQAVVLKTSGAGPQRILMER